MGKESATDVAITASFISPNEHDRNGEEANVVDGLFAIARAIQALAKSIDRLGTADAATPMGAMEVLSLEVKHGAEIIAQAIEHRNEG